MRFKPFVYIMNQLHYVIVYEKQGLQPAVIQQGNIHRKPYIGFLDAFWNLNLISLYRIGSLLEQWRGNGCAKQAFQQSGDCAAMIPISGL